MTNTKVSTGQIYYAITGERGVLKLTGTIRHPLSQRLSQAARKVFAGAGIRQVVVDLQEAQFIDSTCLGLLAQVALRSLELDLEPPILVSPQREITRLLQTTGLDRAFVLIDDPAQPASALTNAENLADVSRRPDPKLVLEAHRALSDLNENNRHMFQSVIEALENDLSADDSIAHSLHRPGGESSYRARLRAH
jgi:anti-anti-sigma factor